MTTPDPDDSTRLTIFGRLWPVLFTILTAILILVSAKFTWPDGDDGRYAVWAISIARGDGITKIHLPEPEPVVVVPPGLSIVLAPVVRIFGPDNLKAMMAFSALVLILLAWIYTRWITRQEQGAMGDGQSRIPTPESRIPNPPSPILPTICIPILALWGVFTVSSAWRIHTEILYMLFSLTAIALWPDRDRPARAAFVPGLLAGAAFLTRTVGLALLPAGILALLFRKQWKKALVFAAAFLAVNLPLTIRTMQLAGTPVGYSQSSGISSLAGQIHTMLVFIPHYLFYGLPDLMFYRLIGADGLFHVAGLDVLARPAGFLIGGLILLGFIKKLFRLDMPELYWGAYFVIIGSFNQPDYADRGQFLFQDRYVIPVIPLAAIYFADALRPKRFAHVPWVRHGMTAVLALSTLYIACTAGGAALSRYTYESAHRGQHPMDPARYADHPNENDRAWGRYFECAFWLSSNATPDAVVYCRKPYEMYLASGRKTQRYLEIGTGEKLLEDMRQWSEGGVYLVEDSFTTDTAFGKEREAIIVPLLEMFPESFEILHETEDPAARVWRFRE